MSFEVTPCADVDEFVTALGAITEYGGWPLDREHAERFLQNLDLARMHAARDDGRIVGGAGAFTFRMTVPGGADVPTAGVTVVGVYPPDRRRGVLRALMTRQLEDVHARGEPIAALWASEETIYGRFGYGMASLQGEITLGREHAAFAAFARGVDERPRLVDADEAGRLVPPVWDRVRAGTPGMFARTPRWWELRRLADPAEFRFGAGPKKHVVVERDGEPVAYAIYRLRSSWESGVPSGKLEVVEALGADPPATRAIWRYLLDMEWVATITAGMAPIDHPLFLLLATPRRMQFRVGDGLWVRIVDVGAALSARAYGSGEPVVFEVGDAVCPWNEGRWRLADGQAGRTDDEPDLRVDVADLGSVYLGGFRWGQLARAGRIGELQEGAVARADAVFATADPAPWCPEIF